MGTKTKPKPQDLIERLLQSANILLTHMCVDELERVPDRDPFDLLNAKANCSRAYIWFRKHVTSHGLGTGLADRMKPILKTAEGVMEEAIAYETERKRQAKAREGKATTPKPRPGVPARGSKDRTCRPAPHDGDDNQPVVSSSTTTDPTGSLSTESPAS
jgi:hypothetical protein